MASEHIDWAATGSMLSGIGAIIMPIFAVGVALYGYNDWKKTGTLQINS